jgi:hypothetical protein
MDIEVYTVQTEFNTPLAKKMGTGVVKHKPLDKIFVIDKKVWVRTHNDNHELALYDAEFVRINKVIFKKD